MPRRTRIQMVGKQAEHNLDKDREYLRRFLHLLRWEWRQRKAVEAIAETGAAAGPDETDG